MLGQGCEEEGGREGGREGGDVPLPVGFDDGEEGEGPFFYAGFCPLSFAVIEEVARPPTRGVLCQEQQQRLTELEAGGELP